MLLREETRWRNMWKAGDNNKRGMEAKELTNGGNNTSDKESCHAKTACIKGFSQAM